MKIELAISLEELMVELLMADMKHTQLTDGLSALDLSAENHYLGIYDLILKLLELEGCDGVDGFTERYLFYMHKSGHFPITNLGEELRPLARQCYQELFMLCEELKDR